MKCVKCGKKDGSDNYPILCYPCWREMIDGHHMERIANMLKTMEEGDESLREYHRIRGRE